MTRQEALAEAQRRWGPKGFADDHGEANPPYLGGVEHRYQVGCRGSARGERAFRDPVGGSGESWETAFSDADARSSR